MRNILMAAVVAVAVMGVNGEARAQYCPGTSGWVFVDVADNDPFCPMITWMAQQGISLGCEILSPTQRNYCPNATVLRSQMSAFLQRTADALFPLNCAKNQVFARPKTCLENCRRRAGCSARRDSPPVRCR